MLLEADFALQLCARSFVFVGDIDRSCKKGSEKGSLLSVAACGFHMMGRADESADMINESGSGRQDDRSEPLQGCTIECQQCQCRCRVLVEMLSQEH